MPSRTEQRLAQQEARLRALTVASTTILVLATLFYGYFYFRNFSRSELITVNPDGVPVKGFELVLAVEDETPTASLVLEGIEYARSHLPSCATAMFLTVTNNRTIDSRPWSELITRTAIKDRNELGSAFPAMTRAPREYTSSISTGSSVSESQTFVFDLQSRLCPGDSIFSHLVYGQPQLLATDIPLTIKSGTELFPYDQYVLSISVGLLPDIDAPLPQPWQIEGIPYLGVGDYSKLPLQIQIQAPAWHTSASIDRKGASDWYSTEITLTRSPILTTLTAILGVTALILIVSLLLIRELSSLLEVGVGMFFGLWAVRSFIVPPYITRTTVVDYVALVMYVVLSIMMISSLVQQVLSNTAESDQMGRSDFTQDEESGEINSSIVSADLEQATTETENLDRSTLPPARTGIVIDLRDEDAIDYQI